MLRGGGHEGLKLFAIGAATGSDILELLNDLAFSRSGERFELLDLVGAVQVRTRNPCIDGNAHRGTVHKSFVLCTLFPSE